MNAIGSISKPVCGTLLRGAILLHLAIGLACLAVWRALPQVQHSRMIPLILGAILLALAGLSGTAIVAWARTRKVFLKLRRWRLILRPSEAARWPQAIAVGVLTIAAIAAASAPPVPANTPPNTAFALGAAALLLGFPLLIVERILASTEAARLPEAAALRAVSLVVLLIVCGAGLLRFAAGLGLPWTDRADTALAWLLSAVALELGLRAAGRCFLPAPADACGACESALARMIAEGLQTRSLAAPIRQHLGIDFSRSWALGFLRRATPPAALLLLALSWGLSGVVLVGLDQRAVYERFGAPVRVLHPGLHLILPYPLGQVRRLEYGTLHETTLSDAPLPVTKAVAAEDLPPPEADRLWETVHPAELDFLIASAGAAAQRQSFQVVSADIKLRYRIGLSDQAANDAAYAVSDPAALLRGAAGRLIGGFFAAHTLDGVLGENREAMAEALRSALQHELDRLHTGLELSAVVIEAIHPPAGAAVAYHAVQAAEIEAVSSISAERGRAIAEQARARQYATDIITQAEAAKAETTGTAQADLTRFNADHTAWRADAEPFLLEARLAAISTGLAKTTLTIIDHRISGDDTPTLDYRPPGAPTVPAPHQGQE